MRQKRFILVLVALAAAAAGGAGVWFATMPYPRWIAREAKLHTQYSANWPVSQEDFAKAECLVRRELRFREIISDVTVSATDEIRFGTLRHWKGPLWADGNLYTVRKLQGEWRIVERSFWIS